MGHNFFRSLLKDPRKLFRKQSSNLPVCRDLNIQFPCYKTTGIQKSGLKLFKNLKVHLHESECHTVKLGNFLHQLNVTKSGISISNHTLSLASSMSIYENTSVFISNLDHPDSILSQLFPCKIR